MGCICVCVCVLMYIPSGGPVELVSFLMKNGGFPQLCKRFPEGTYDQESYNNVQSPAYVCLGGFDPVSPCSISGKVTKTTQEILLWFKGWNIKGVHDSDTTNPGPISKPRGQKVSDQICSQHTITSHLGHILQSRFSTETGDHLPSDGCPVKCLVRG